MHSDKYERIKRYYDKGLWGETAVHNAVVKGWITEEEYVEITGHPYGL